MTKEQKYRLFLFLAFGIGPVLMLLVGIVFSLLVLTGVVK